MRAGIQRRTLSPGVRTIAPWLFLLALLLTWTLVVALARPPAYMLPAPLAVARKLSSALVSPTFWPAFGVTFAEALGGCLLGAVVALPLAVVIHRSPVARAAITPFLGAT